jgi:hypothetical protein
MPLLNEMSVPTDRTLGKGSTDEQMQPTAPQDAGPVWREANAERRQDLLGTIPGVKKNILTFAEPVLVPGLFLKPGAYAFRWMESSVDRNLGVIVNDDCQQASSLVLQDGHSHASCGDADDPVRIPFA